METKTEEFLSKIDRDAIWHWNKQGQLRALKGIIMIAVAAAGVLTASAGITGTQSSWYATPEALTVWGLITAVGAAIDQWANPGKRAEDHLQRKLALRAIESAVRYQGIELSKASELWNVALANPETALRTLAGQPDDDRA